MQASRNGNDLWLSYWVDTTSETAKTGLYLVHAGLLRNLINAPVSFFENNPSGRVLNRLSSDLYMVDDSLPFILNILLANFFSLLGTAVVLSYAQVSFLIVLIPIWYICNRLQSYEESLLKNEDDSEDLSLD